MVVDPRPNQMEAHPRQAHAGSVLRDAKRDFPVCRVADQLPSPGGRALLSWRQLRAQGTIPSARVRPHRAGFGRLDGKRHLNLTGEFDERDHHQGHLVADSGMRELLARPDLTVSWRGRLTGEVGPEVPLWQDSHGRHLATDLRLHAAAIRGAAEIA